MSAKHTRVIELQQKARRNQLTYDEAAELRVLTEEAAKERVESLGRGAATQPEQPHSR